MQINSAIIPILIFSRIVLTQESRFATWEFSWILSSYSRAKQKLSPIGTWPSFGWYVYCGLTWSETHALVIAQLNYCSSFYIKLLKITQKIQLVENCSGTYPYWTARMLVHYAIAMAAVLFINMFQAAGHYI